MGRLMSKKRTLDMEKVSAALKRAAAAAVSGQRDAKSGRFTAIQTQEKTDRNSESVGKK